MDLSLLATLKRKLTEATDFSEVLAYFFDHFGDDPAFLDLGETAEDSFLETLLAQIGKSIFHKEVEVRDLLLRRLPQHRFIHGGCLLNGRVGTLFYFEDALLGLVAVAVGPGDTKLARFTGRVQAPKPSRN